MDTGGTSGLVLADRLSESGSQRVLVLEAGPKPDIVAMYKAPGAVEFLGGELMSTSVPFMSKSFRSAKSYPS